MSCVEASYCWAVGSVQVGTVSQTLTEHWNGRTWVRVLSPSPPVPGEGDALEGVSCQSVESCWAVGTGGIVPAAHHSIILHWTGATWTVVTPPPLGCFVHAFDRLLGARHGRDRPLERIALDIRA